MNQMRLGATLFALLSVNEAAAQSDGPRLPVYSKTPDELATVAPTGGAGGSGNVKVQVVTLLGDPSKPGPYSQLLKVAPHASIAAHHHAGDRVGTVLKGNWALGYGAKFDEAKLRPLPPGSVYTEPANEAHFARTGDDAVIVLITGYGPTDTVYENPADDPAAKK